MKGITIATIGQTAYLTGHNFAVNSLIAHARSCAFSFLFSFIPIFMMVALVLVRVLHASPEFIMAIFKFIPELGPYFEIEEIIATMQNFRGITGFGIVIGITIFWFARGLFSSVFQGLKDICHTEQKPKQAIMQLAMLLIEVSIVIIIAAIVFFFLLMQAIVTLPLFSGIAEYIAPLTKIISAYYIDQLPNVLLFIIITILYRIGTGTKPSLKQCLFFALLCTVSFMIFRFVMHSLIDFSRYNFVYGMLAKLIVTMLDVFIFFMLFFVYAQMMFVYQFFDELLLGELYLLPKENEKKTLKSFQRKILIRPDILLARKKNVIHLKTGETVFSPQDKDTNAYYVVNGSLKETNGNSVTVYRTGDFFGEVSCIIHKGRESTVQCMTDADLVRIESAKFRSAISKNNQASAKLIAQINAYFSNLYGRTQ